YLRYRRPTPDSKQNPANYTRRGRPSRTTTAVVGERSSVDFATLPKALKSASTVTPPCDACAIASVSDCGRSCRYRLPSSGSQGLVPDCSRRECAIGRNRPDKPRKTVRPIAPGKRGLSRLQHCAAGIDSAAHDPRPADRRREPRSGGSSGRQTASTSDG